MHCN